MDTPNKLLMPEVPLIFDLDDSDKASELLRMSLSRLNAKGVDVNPLNYALTYTFFSGKSQPLNDKMDAYLNGDQQWAIEDMKELFTRFLISCQDVVDEEVHAELVTLVANIFGMLTETLGKTALSNQKLKGHIEKLAQSRTQQTVMQSANGILREARAFVKESTYLETEFKQFSHEVSKLKTELNQAKQEALTDALTGINNRRAFDEKLDKLLESGKQFCLIIADLDHFKNINDKYGHIIGDRVLSAFASVLSQKTRESDFNARYGGEEFAILLPNTQVTQAQTVAEHIRETVENLSLKNTKTGKKLDKFTVSLGISCHRSGEDAKALIDRCDKAMYKAKHSGRNQAVVG